MFLKFLRMKRKAILGIFVMWGIIVVTKYGMPFIYETSRYRSLIDICILIGLPVAITMDFLHFRKMERRKKNSEP